MLTGQSLDFIQLAAVDGIRGITADVACRDIGDLVAPIAQTAFRQADIITFAICIGMSNRDAVVVDDRIAHIDRASVSQVQILVQLNQELAVFAVLAGYHADVPIGQVGFILGIALDVDLLVQFHSRSRAKVAAEFQAVIEGGGFVGIPLRILIDDAGHGFPILAVQARRTCRRPDIRNAVFAVETDMAFGTIDAIHAIFAGNGDTAVAIRTFNGNTILAVKGYAGIPVLSLNVHMAIAAILAVLAGTANGEIVAELEIINLLPVSPRRLGNLKVAVRIGTIAGRSRAAIDGDFRMMFVNVTDCRIDIRLDRMQLVFRGCPAGYIMRAIPCCIV